MFFSKVSKIAISAGRFSSSSTRPGPAGKNRSRIMALVPELKASLASPLVDEDAQLSAVAFGDAAQDPERALAAAPGGPVMTRQGLRG